MGKYPRWSFLACSFLLLVVLSLPSLPRAEAATRVGSLTLPSGNDNARNLAIDGDYAFVSVNWGGDSRIVKIRLSDFTYQGYVSLGSGWGNSPCSLVAEGGYLYAGMWTEPGTVRKIRESDLSVMSTLTLSNGPGYLWSAVIGGGYAYFGGGWTDTAKKIARVRLSDFTHQGTIDTSSAGDHWCGATIDTSGGYAYFATTQGGGGSTKVVRIRLSDFTWQGTLTFSTGGGCRGASSAPYGGFIYFVDTAGIHKVRLSDFTEQGVFTLPSGVNTCSFLAVDTSQGFMYHCGSNPALLSKIRLSDNSVVEQIQFNTGETGPSHGAGPKISGSFLYFGGEGSPGKVMKADLTKTLITITSSPTGSGFVKVDGNTITTPQTFEWVIGSSHTLEALSPVSGGSGIQYVFQSWSDGGAQTHSYTTPSSPATVTANYGTQYYLTVNSNPSGVDNPRPSGWYNPGTVVTVQCDTPSSGGSGIQYLFTGWSGDASGSNPSTTVTVNAPKTATANYKTQYQVTFTSSGIGSDTTGAVVTVNGATKTQSQLPFTDWYDSGATINYAFSSTVSTSSGKQYVWTSTSGLGQSGRMGSFSVTGTGTVTGTYKTQYQLAMQVNPAGSSSTSPAVGSYWYDSGSSVSISATPASGYTFSSWSGSGSGSYSGTDNPKTITMNGPITETANFQVATVSITITSSPTGSGFIKVDGASITTPKIYSWTIGSTHTLEAISPVSGGSGKQYVWVSWSDGGGQTHTYTTPSSSATVTANYKTQYQLSVNVNNPLMGSTNPSSGIYWYDSGVNVQVTAIANPSYAFSHWNLDGANAGSSNPITVTMSGAHTLVAHFSSGAVAVTITSDPTGSDLIEVDGQPITTPQTFTWPQASNHTLEALSPVSTDDPGVRYVWVSWSDGGAQKHQITVSGSSLTFTANYKMQYLLLVDTDPAGLSPQPTGWYDAGTAVTLTADLTISEFGLTFSFKQWKVDGTAKAEGLNQITVTMNSPHTAVACYGQSVSSSGQIAFSMYNSVVVYASAIATSALCLALSKLKKKSAKTPSATDRQTA